MQTTEVSANYIKCIDPGFFPNSVMFLFYIASASCGPSAFLAADSEIHPNASRPPRHTGRAARGLCCPRHQDSAVPWGTAGLSGAGVEQIEALESPVPNTMCHGWQGRGALRMKQVNCAKGLAEAHSRLTSGCASAHQAGICLPGGLSAAWGARHLSVWRWTRPGGHQCFGAG